MSICMFGFVYGRQVSTNLNHAECGNRMPLTPLQQGKLKCVRKGALHQEHLQPEEGHQTSGLRKKIMLIEIQEPSPPKSAQPQI